MAAKNLLYTTWLALLVSALTACPSGGGNRFTEADAASGRMSDGTVKFQYNGHLYFDALIGDSLPARLIFDTGATGLYIDSLWLVQSGFAPVYRQTAFIGGAGAGLDKTELFRDTLRFCIDSVLWSSRMTVVLQLKELLGRQVDGIFGQGYLAGQCVEFNLRRGYMRLASADTLAAAGFVRHDIEKRGDRIYVRAGVEFDAEHKAEGLFLLDTGSPHPVMLSRSAAGQARFDSYRGHKVAYGTLWAGIGGGGEGFHCRAEAVVFGGHSFAYVPVGVSSIGLAYTAKDDVMGAIGNALFARFDMVIDFAAPALWLRPAEGVDEPFRYISPGFSTVDRTDICDGWLVSMLHEPPYAPAGLQKGDMIVTWDGVTVRELNIDSVLKVRGPHRIETIRDGERTEYEFEIKELL